METLGTPGHVSSVPNSKCANADGAREECWGGEGSAATVPTVSDLKEFSSILLFEKGKKKVMDIVKVPTVHENVSEILKGYTPKAPR